MSSQNLVLWDIDGTLMSGVGPQHKEALIEAARQIMGVTCTLDNVDTSGKIDRDLIHTMLANAGVAKRRVIPKMTSLMHAAQNRYIMQSRADFSAKLCPGVKETLELLSRLRIPMGLVTGNLSAIAWRKLENAGIDHHFAFGAFAEEGRSRAFLAKHAVLKARRKGLADKRCRVTLIGDHANDIDAAHQNGFRSLAVATGLMPANQLLQCNPDLMLNILEGASLEIICGKE